MAKDLPFKFENARCMVLDEVSMIGTNLFTKISLRLQEIISLLPKWKFHSFGGIYLFILEPTLTIYIYIYIYIWQYPVRGSIFNLNFPKIVVNDIALNFWLFRLSSKIQSC